jgi:hypothetical protein
MKLLGAYNMYLISNTTFPMIVMPGRVSGVALNAFFNIEKITIENSPVLVFKDTQPSPYFDYESREQGVFVDYNGLLQEIKYDIDCLFKRFI